MNSDAKEKIYLSMKILLDENTERSFRLKTPERSTGYLGAISMHSLRSRLACSIRNFVSRLLNLFSPLMAALYFCLQTLTAALCAALSNESAVDEQRLKAIAADNAT